jgi:hypothetical protein
MKKQEQLNLWIGRNKWVLQGFPICDAGNVGSILWMKMRREQVMHRGEWRKCKDKLDLWIEISVRGILWMKRRKCCEVAERNVAWKVEICIAHYLVENEIPWCPQTYPLQCRNNDASHHASCKTNTKNLVLVFILLYEIKITFYNYWLPSAICRRFSFPCNMPWDPPAERNQYMIQ